MGSLTSRPKVPVQQSQPKIVYVPAPSPEPVTVSQPVTPVTNTAPVTQNKASQEPVPTAEEIVEKQRAENLVRRNRGRFGTVLTGFRGILSQSASQFTGGPQRKTLLGE